MPKISKESKSLKLYHGTTESIAKNACVKGLMRYKVEPFDYGVAKKIFASTEHGICLTSIYPGLMSFDTAINREKWGIIEIDSSHLSPEHFLPHEGYLCDKKVRGKMASEEDRVRKMENFRSTASSLRRLWRDSVNDFGMCVYEKDIPLSAITKVAIYDPFSNPMMTKAMLTTLGGKFHKSNLHRQDLIIRWLMGENITAQTWLGAEVFTKMVYSDKDKTSQILLNKSGLDIFYSGSSHNKKTSWW